MTKQMAKREPGDRMVWADDSMKFTPREWLKIAVGSVLMVVVFAAVMLGLAVVQ